MRCHEAVLLCLCSLMCIPLVSTEETYRSLYFSQENDLDVSISIQQNKNFSFASYYQDHMVLQRSSKGTVVWGYASLKSIGQQVKVTLTPSEHKYSAEVTAGPDPNTAVWRVLVMPVEYKGPYVIQASSVEGNIKITDVLFGDVWVCSGQSNMQFAMSQIFNASAELKDSVNYVDVRIFAVKRMLSTTALYDLPDDGIWEPWSLPSPATLGNGSFSYFSAVCWLYGKYLYDSLKTPIGLVESCVGGTPVEAWSSSEALHRCGLDDDTWSSQNEEVLYFGDTAGPTQHNNSVLWNAMIHPLINMTIFGAIWYQGEANTIYNIHKYKCTFPAMIDDWREKFHAGGGTDLHFPFGFVQLAAENGVGTSDIGFPDIRWHQTADYGYAPNKRMNNTFMAVAMDLPDFLSPYGSIHPRDKQDVSARLVLGSLAVAYGHKDVTYQGPYPNSVCTHVEDKMTFITITYNGEDVIHRDITGFEICCAFTKENACGFNNSWWLPAIVANKGAHLKSTTLVNMDCNAANIVSLRYAWHVTPCPFKNCAVYGEQSGLPLPPFILPLSPALGKGVTCIDVKQVQYSPPYIK